MDQQKMILVPEEWVKELFDKARKAINSNSEEDNTACIGWALSSSTLLESGIRYGDYGENECKHQWFKVCDTTKLAKGYEWIDQKGCTHHGERRGIIVQCANCEVDKSLFGNFVV